MDDESARLHLQGQADESLCSVLTAMRTLGQAFDSTGTAGGNAMIDRGTLQAPRRPVLAALRRDVLADATLPMATGPREPAPRERATGRGRPQDLDLASAMLDLQVQQVTHREAIDATARVLHPALLEYLR